MVVSRSAGNVEGTMAAKPTKYEYNIYSNPEDIALTIEVDEPLPHLEVGHQLILFTADYHRNGGMVIEQVRSSIVFLKGAFKRYQIHVYCKEVDKLPTIGAQKSRPRKAGS
jgi:hypothetical protein